ncbi:nucleotidyltransferase family protein [Comamonas terrigena]|uniref:nucleotidyltransferase family protein n=1 Tax=Comamonas terrigena TaxID=32013 RepID=UPI00244C04CB|nr:nucleotidyltransferase family protein [Comamonas terrigena]MDH1703371.1 nucleotidyltransferase family protein [Comamonas terrigena]
MQALSSETLVALAMENPANRALLALLPALDLPQCMLTAGCLFQTVWNLQSGRPPQWGIKDYDVIYFDDDLSWEAEDRIIARVCQACQHLGVHVEVRNQARVHLWYAQKFGASYAPLQRATDGIDRYLICSTCIGVDVATGALYSTHGLDDLQRNVLRINPLNHQPAMFADKARSYQERWPWLTVEAAC